MVDLSARGEAAREYAEAYEAHHSRRDLASAIHVYRKLRVNHRFEV